MSLQEGSAVYIEKQIDKAGLYTVRKLNPLVSPSWSLPWVTTQQMDGNVSVQWYSKTVGSIDGFNTRLTQNEQEIALVANDVSWNTAELVVQAAQISSMVSDIDTNYSLIAQNASNITLEVSNRASADAALQSSITINTNNINLKVSKNDVINQINVSTEGITISANKITLAGNTEFVSLSSTVSNKVNVWGAANDINANITTINGGKITTGSITTWQLSFTPVQPGTGTNAVNSSGKVTSIDGSSITVSNISADNITTGTLTGRTVQTAASNKRISLDWTLNRLSFFNTASVEIAYLEAENTGAPYNADVVRVKWWSFACENGIIAGTGFLTTATSALWTTNPYTSATYDLWTSTRLWRDIRVSRRIYFGTNYLSFTWSNLFWNWVQLN